MTKGTIIMIGCVVLYGLIVILFRGKEQCSQPDDLVQSSDQSEKKNTGAFPGEPGLFCSDGTPGADGLLADDFDRISDE